MKTHFNVGMTDNEAGDALAAEIRQDVEKNQLHIEVDEKEKVVIPWNARTNIALQNMLEKLGKRYEIVDTGNDSINPIKAILEVLYKIAIEEAISKSDAAKEYAAKRVHEILYGGK